MDLSDTLKHIEILKIFKKEPFSVISTSHVEAALGLSHHPTFRKLKSLEKNGVLIKQKGGYSLNVQNELVLEIMKFISAIEKIREMPDNKNGKD